MDQMKAKTIKLLEKEIGNPNDLGLGKDYTNRTQNALIKKETLDGEYFAM